MTRLARYMAISATVAASTLACPALANKITFETASLTAFTGSVTEDGFTYSTLSGALFVNDRGNPGHDMEGSSVGGGGVLKIVSATGGNFTFDSLDFSAFASTSPPTGSQTLMVEGFLGGSPVGTDQYTAANTNTVQNWATEAASVLAGKTLSELDIPLNAGEGPPAFSEDIDNVVLTPVSVPAVPEPGSLALLASGLLALGWMRRRKS